MRGQACGLWRSGRKPATPRCRGTPIERSGCDGVRQCDRPIASGGPVALGTAGYGGGHDHLRIQQVLPSEGQPADAVGAVVCANVQQQDGPRDARRRSVPASGAFSMNPVLPTMHGRSRPVARSAGGIEPARRDAAAPGPAGAAHRLGSLARWHQPGAATARPPAPPAGTGGVGAPRRAGSARSLSTGTRR